MLRRVRLWLVPVAFCAVDVTATLLGQPSDYWAGQRDQVREANPVADAILRWHPLAFVVGAVALMGVYVLLIERLPRNLARVASFVIVFLHAVGAATWFVRLGVVGYALAVGWLLLGSLLLSWAWRHDGA